MIESRHVYVSFTECGVTALTTNCSVQLCSLGLCNGKYLAIQYVSRYRVCDTICFNTLRYCKEGDILGLF